MAILARYIQLFQLVSKSTSYNVNWPLIWVLKLVIKLLRYYFWLYNKLTGRNLAAVLTAHLSFQWGVDRQAGNAGLLLQRVNNDDIRLLDRNRVLVINWDNDGARAAWIMNNCQPSEGRADRLAPEEGGGSGGEWGQLAQAVETIPRRPVPFATWRNYDIITLRLKYTLIYTPHHAIYPPCNQEDSLVYCHHVQPSGKTAWSMPTV